jgi:hypothetical protein
MGGAGVVALLLLLAKGLPAVRRWDQRQIVVSSDVVRRAAALSVAVKGASFRNRELDHLRRRRMADDSSVLDFPTVGDAPPRFAGMIRDLASDANVSLETVQPRIDSTAGRALRIVSARVSLTTDLPGLTDLLRLVERNRPALRIARLSVSAANAVSGDNQPDVLRVEMTIEGLADISAVKRVD